MKIYKTEHLKYRLDPVSEIFENINCMLAGGSCLSAVKESLGYDIIHKMDYDFFFETEEEYNRANERLQKLIDYIDTEGPWDCLGKGIFESDFAKTFDYDGLQIQLIKIFKPFKDITLYPLCVKPFGQRSRDLDGTPLL